ncbi:hypothetical protein V6N12_008035 [Hibiscus sabdariffa]|uniref:Uncharacterized protein n=1 Tax=Hibiscus sabdariffa TaxID=183260 RepID=A0ABR2BU39_9ROSI
MSNLTSVRILFPSGEAENPSGIKARGTLNIPQHKHQRSDDRNLSENGAMSFLVHLGFDRLNSIKHITVKIPLVFVLSISRSYTSSLYFPSL